jgi:hypothetical protein
MVTFPEDALSAGTAAIDVSCAADCVTAAGATASAAKIAVVVNNDSAIKAVKIAVLKDFILFSPCPSSIFAM